MQLPTFMPPLILISLLIVNRAFPSTTLVLMNFNGRAYIQTAVASVLAQKFKPSEIILSDDCSVDDSFELLQDLARQHRHTHHIVVRRNDRNLGPALHLQECVKIARGEIIIVAAHDDVSLPQRTKAVVEAFQTWGPNTKLAFSDFELIDHRGKNLGTCQASLKQPNWSKPRIPGTPPGATMAFRCELFDKFGPIVTRAVEDDVLIFRAWLIGQVARIPEVLVKYRRHPSSVSTGWSGKRLANYKAKYRIVLANWTQRLIDYKYALTHSLNPPGLPSIIIPFIKSKIREAKAYLLISTGEKRLIERGFQLFLANKHYSPNAIIRCFKLALLAALPPTKSPSSQFVL